MLRSIFSNWLGMAILGVISVIFTPILIHRLGSFYYGMWILAASVVDYYGLLDVGMRWTLFRFVAHFKGANQRTALNEAFVIGFVITTAAGILVIGLTVATVVVLPRFFHMVAVQRHIFVLLLALAGVCVAIAFPAQFLSAYLRGLQRFDLYNASLIVSGLVRAILLGGVLWRGFGVLAVAQVTVIIGILTLLLNWWFVRRADPELSVAWAYFSWTRTWELVSFSFYTFLSSAGEYLRFYTDSLVIGRILGVALVTPFSIATRLMEYFKSIMVGVNGPLMVQMGELDGQSRHGDLRRAFLRFTRITALLSLLIGFGLILNGRTLIRLWVGEGFASSYVLIVVLTIGYVVAYAQQPSMLVIFARARHHRALGWWTLLEGLANLLLSIYLARRYGLIGVAFGTMVPLLVIKLFVQPWYALKAIGLSGWEYGTRAIARPATAGAIFFCFCWFARVPSAAESALHLLLTVAWQTALFGILAYTVGLTHSDRQSLRHRSLRLAMSLRLVQTQ